MIKLMKNTFYKEEETKENLINFIRGSHQLSMGPKCEEFEGEFSKFQERRYSVLVNSGSSANLALIQSLLNLKRIKKGDCVAFSTLTWSTDVMPLIQLGLKPIPVDVSLKDLNISYNSLLDVLSKYPIKMLFLTNLLGFCSRDSNLIRDICDRRGIILIEDNCESLGSVAFGRKLGNFGLASTFSFFVGHAMSTIEGGVIATDDEELADMLHIVKAHGWDRSLSKEKQHRIRMQNEVDEFYGKFSFYHLSYNVRPTEVTGFLGLEQLKYINEIVSKRDNNFRRYEEAAKKNPSLFHFDFGYMEKISNHAYPLLFKDRDTFEKYKKIFSEKMEIRPIVAGNMLKQPFLKEGQMDEKFLCENADKIHDYGFYIPNNAELTEDEVSEICSLISGERKYEIECCRSCGSKNLIDIISFGEQHVIDFVDSQENQSEKVPLDLVLCRGCNLLQLKHNAPNETMWGGHYWYKSAINKLIRDDLKDIVNCSEKIINLKRGDLVIDIGCNDGTLFEYYDREGVDLVGFEPSKNVAREATQKGFKIINDYFNHESFRKEFGQRKAKIITAISMFYDLEDPNKFLRDAVECLDREGFLVIQQNYLLKMLENNTFDNVCHEHREYYSLLSFRNLLERHGLEIFDISMNEINGGSIRTYIRFKGNEELVGFKGARERITEAERIEREKRMDTPEPYLNFAKRIDSLKEEIMNFVDEEIRRGKTFGICGASTRGNTILQYFGLDHRRIIAAAEANPDKWGKKTVGGLIPIVSVEEMQKINPDYQIVMIWHLFEGLLKKEKEYLKKGGKFILPLPKFKIVGEYSLQDDSSN